MDQYKDGQLKKMAGKSALSETAQFQKERYAECLIQNKKNESSNPVTMPKMGECIFVKNKILRKRKNPERLDAVGFAPTASLV